MQSLLIFNNALYFKRYVCQIWICKVTHCCKCQINVVKLKVKLKSTYTYTWNVLNVSIRLYKKQILKVQYLKIVQKLSTCVCDLGRSIVSEVTYLCLTTGGIGTAEVGVSLLLWSADIGEEMGVLLSHLQRAAEHQGNSQMHCSKPLTSLLLHFHL